MILSLGRTHTGGSDKNVVVWNFNDDPTKSAPSVRYTHESAVKGLAWSPTYELLASCGGAEVAVWSAKAKEIKKPRMKSDIVCIAWTPDAENIVVGLECGDLSVCNKDGSPRHSIAIGQLPISSVACYRESDSERTLIGAVDFGKTMSFFTVDGTSVQQARKLDFLPTSLSVADEGRTFLVTGSHGKVKKSINLRLTTSAVLCDFFIIFFTLSIFRFLFSMQMAFSLAT